MSDDETRFTQQPLAVMFADIAGSTALYDEFGDAIARDATAACLSLMSQVVGKFEGRVVKTIGDEVMAVFNDAARAIMASTDLQSTIQGAGEDGAFSTGPLRIKVGVHFGPGMVEAGEIYGEGVRVARQIIGLAKADQTLISGALLDAVPPMLRMSSRFFDRIIAEGSGKAIEVHEMIWEVRGLTQVAESDPQAPRPETARLELNYQGEVFYVDEQRPHLGLGRVSANDITVATDLTSRQHASIEYKRGRFNLSDNSSNGTIVVDQDGGILSLRRESTVLRGTGKICLGGTPLTNPGGVLEFRVL